MPFTTVEEGRALRTRGPTCDQVIAILASYSM